MHVKKTNLIFIDEVVRYLYNKKTTTRYLSTIKRQVHFHSIFNYSFLPVNKLNEAQIYIFIKNEFPSFFMIKISRKEKRVFSHRHL